MKSEANVSAGHLRRLSRGDRPSGQGCPKVSGQHIILGDKVLCVYQLDVRTKCPVLFFFLTSGQTDTDTLSLYRGVRPVSCPKCVPSMPIRFTPPADRELSRRTLLTCLDGRIKMAAMGCAVCGSPDAVMTRKAVNALPAGVTICADCLEAVRKRQVGIVRHPDGTLDITDGRYLRDLPAL